MEKKMPIKLITSILTVAIIGIFAGFNWGEGSRCSVDLVFFQTPEIPVFIIIIVSFLLGVVVMSLISLLGKFGSKKVDPPPVDLPKNEPKNEPKKVDIAPIIDSPNEKKS